MSHLLVAPSSGKKFLLIMEACSLELAGRYYDVHVHRLRYNTPEFHDSDDWSCLEDYSTSDHHDDLMPSLVVIKTGRRGW